MPKPSGLSNQLHIPENSHSGIIEERSSTHYSSTSPLPNTYENVSEYDSAQPPYQNQNAQSTEGMPAFSNVSAAANAVITTHHAPHAQESHYCEIP